MAGEAAFPLARGLPLSQNREHEVGILPERGPVFRGTVFADGATLHQGEDAAAPLDQLDQLRNLAMPAHRSWFNCFHYRDPQGRHPRAEVFRPVPPPFCPFPRFCPFYGQALFGQKLPLRRVVSRKYHFSFSAQT